MTGTAHALWKLLRPEAKRPTRAVQPAPGIFQHPCLKESVILQRRSPSLQVLFPQHNESGPQEAFQWQSNVPALESTSNIDGSWRVGKICSIPEGDSKQFGGNQDSAGAKMAPFLRLGVGNHFMHTRCTTFTGCSTANFRIVGSVVV